MAFKAVGGTVRRNLTDKMMSGTFEFQGTIPNTNDTHYFKYTELQIIDYLGNYNPVFIGFYPSSTKNFSASGDNETFDAFDHSWYLTMQYLSDDNLALLTQEHQISDAQKKYWQAFSQIIPPVPPYYAKAVFEVGDTVIGTTSHASGVIYEVNYAGSRYFRVKSTTNTPFSSGENLYVDGIRYGIADGASLDETGAPIYIISLRPEEYITQLLGASGWRGNTGIEPYRITSTYGYYGVGLEKPEVDFIFDQKTTKIAAIEKICKYLEYIFIVKPRIVGTFTPLVMNVSQQSAYFLKESDIDRESPYGLDLPPEATVINPDKYLVSPVVEESKGEEKYNKIRVRCQSLDGYWYTAIRQTPGVSGGDEIAIEFLEINEECSTQDECDERADDLYTYYSTQIKSWVATFNLRSDLQLLQKISFSGFQGNIESGSIDDHGIGYSVGDILTVIQEDGSGGSFRVAAVTPGGHVAQLAVYRSGMGYTSESGGVETSASPPGGTGCTVQISASGSDIPDGTYRIVGIEYTFSDGGLTNQTKCTLVLDGQFKAYLNLNRVFTSALTESQIIARDELEKHGTPETGTVLSVNNTSGEVMVKTDSGTSKIARSG